MHGLRPVLDADVHLAGIVQDGERGVCKARESESLH